MLKDKDKIKRGSIVKETILIGTNFTRIRIGVVLSTRGLTSNKEKSKRRMYGRGSRRWYYVIYPTIEVAWIGGAIEKSMWRVILRSRGKNKITYLDSKGTNIEVVVV